jgi:flagellar biogenesis protein FliO
VNKLAAATGNGARAGGLAGWILERWRQRQRPRQQARLAVLERIALAPRQSLALVEADGRRFLVTTSAEGPAALYPLQSSARAGRRTRISW